MRTDRDFDRIAPQLDKPLLRHSQLWWRATPKKIRGCCRDDQKLGMKLIQLSLDLARAQSLQMRIDQQRIVSGSPDLVEGEHQFQRIMRLLAAKVSRAFEAPRRIYQGKPHEAASGICSSAGPGAIDMRTLVASCVCHHSYMDSMFWRMLISGFHPVCFLSFWKSVT